ncbi:hypothetical protein ACE1ET_12970 [Saccharicrinis sp. FJH62]|uniref:hypothetical protein n=1 Tax=Saccharicrinis sp. FJH62 TaxID=3344657 RepID=UPI0035D4D80C
MKYQIYNNNKMRAINIFLFVLIILLSSCIKEPVETDRSSIIGRVLDKASGQPLSSATLIIENEDNNYISTTNFDGYFEFKEIINGEYTVISKKKEDAITTKSSQFDGEITDTLGFFSTDSKNWGNLYSQTFCSLTGNITIPEISDYSEINVKLLGTDKSALTTNKGFFRFDFIFPGIYDIVLEKDNYRKLSVNNIIVNKGEIYNIDTIIQPIHKLITIEENALEWPHRDVIDFAFCEGKFWYCKSADPLMAYNPESGIESSHLWKNLDFMNHPYGLAGNCDITDTYENSFWISGDAAVKWYVRKIEIKNNNALIVDSVDTGKYGMMPYNFGWDPKSKSLIVPTGYNDQLQVFNTNSRQLKTISVNLDLEYEETIYKGDGGYIRSIIVDPNGTIFLLIFKETIYDKRVMFMFKYDDLENMNLIDSYIFPDTYTKFNMLSYYMGNIYIAGDRLNLN